MLADFSDAGLGRLFAGLGKPKVGFFCQWAKGRLLSADNRNTEELALQCGQS